MISCDGRQYVNKSSSKSSTPKQWVELINMKGNGQKKSGFFTFTGGDAKLTYNFYNTTYSDVGRLLIYVVPKGRDIAKQGGTPELSVSRADKGESNLSHLKKGEYYLLIMSANGDWDISIQELK